MSELANEMQEVMGRSYGMPELDEDDLEAELDALGDEIGLDDDVSYLDDVATPSIPSSEPGAESARVSSPCPCCHKNVTYFSYYYIGPTLKYCLFALYRPTSFYVGR